MNTPDPRFFDPLGPISLAELTRSVGAQCEPQVGDRQVDAVSVLAQAGEAAVAFLENRRYAEEARSTRAAACFVSPGDAQLLPSTCVPLVTPTPRAAWALAAAGLHRPRRLDPDAPPVHPRAELEEGVEVAPGTFIGEGAQIGAGAVLAPGAVVGPGVAVGRGCFIGPNVVVGFALLGDGVRLCGGAVIGEPGFGVAISFRGLIDVPQLGRVILQDNVSIGANSCVDRGAFDDTVIGENTKIDNLVQIAHNVRIGRNCVLAAHTGISGSVTIGDGAMLGGRVGVKDHIAIGAGVQLGANSGVMRDVPAGEVWGGFPAQPAKRWLREAAWLSRAASARARGDKP